VTAANHLALDPSLLDLFRAEIDVHLPALGEGLLALEKDPRAAERLEALMRAAHSIKGAAKIVGVEPAVRIAHALEDCFVAAQGAELLLDSDGIDALLRGVDALQRITVPDASEKGAVTEDELRGLLDALAAVRAGEKVGGGTAKASAEDSAVPPRPPEPSPPPTAPRPLIYEFVGEAKEHLANVSDDLLALEQGKDDSSHYRIDRLFRALHSVKGGAGFFGCRRIEELAHHMETVCERMRQGAVAVEPGVIDALLASADRIHALLDDAERSNEADVGPVLDRLRPFLGEGGKESKEAREADAPPGRPPAAAPAPPPQGGAGSIRIPVPLVDRLMTLAGELVLVRNQAVRAIAPGDPALGTLAQRLNAVTSDLQDAAMRMRMQPVGNLFGKFPRMVRDLARQLGKRIELEVLGTEVELDKTILEALSDPLTHLVRNACDHGIEPAAQRRQAGKPEEGRIVLSARHLGGRIAIEVRDDGRGIDAAAVRRKALEQGLRSPAELARLGDREVLALILLPGFSTAREVTDVSGRGVGMDVVKTNLDQLGGTLEIDSAPGRGTTFTLHLPLTLAIIPCLLVSAGGQTYAISQKDVEELVCLQPGQGQTRIETAYDREMVRLRGRLLPLVRLTEVLSSSPLTPDRSPTRGEGGNGAAAPLQIAVAKVGSRRFGLVVDDILDTEEIVVKPLHAALKALPVYSGATVLGDGRAALILSAEGIARHAGVAWEGAARPGADGGPDGAARAESQTVLLFRYGPHEQLAVPLALIRRIEMVQAGRIERVGDREFVAVEGVPTPVLRLDAVLGLSPCPDRPAMLLLLPKNLRRPLGVLLSEIIDTETVPLDFSDAAYRADGLLGSAVVRGRMTLFLDLDRLADLAAEPGQPPPARPAPAGRRVLLVEDTQFFRRLVTGYLEGEGYEVVVAAHGAEGLGRLREGAFDLVVSDIEMPVMDGWAFARAVRDEPAFARLPLLALTTLNSAADRDKALACGFNGYEVKLERERFLAAVAALLPRPEAASHA
jgi:two-component system chemotaxis sensor kinase CheA